MSQAAASTLQILAPMRIEARAVRGAVRTASVRCTGVGRERSSEAAAEIATGERGALAVAGLCGALEATLDPGDAVVASEVRGHGATRRCDAAETLASAVEALGLRVHRGPILSVDHVVRGDEREALRETGALAVDMESAWLAAGAATRPFAVLRIVLDTPERELYSADLPIRTVRALRVLRRAAPALEAWAQEAF